ncbi:hypothetical protein Tco_0027889, partial [Tanacetum coccineum]
MNKTLYSFLSTIIARLVRIEELCVAANSRLVVDVMLVYIKRDTARDMQYAIDLTKLWQELVDRVSKRDLFIGEMELLNGSFVASSCVEFFKKLQQCDQLKLMKLVKLIAEM